MLTIRLQRVGRKNQPVFRIVLAEKHRAVKKKAIEILGHYNPRTKEFGVKDEARLRYWIGQHIELSPTVHNLLVNKGILEAEKVKAWRPKAKKEAPAAEEKIKEQTAPTSTEKEATKPEATKEEPQPESVTPEKTESPPAS